MLAVAIGVGTGETAVVHSRVFVNVWTEAGIIVPTVVVTEAFVVKAVIGNIAVELNERLASGGHATMMFIVVIVGRGGVVWRIGRAVIG